MASASVPRGMLTPPGSGGSGSVMVGGTHYVRECVTRTGGYGGLCAEMILPSYSLAKSIVGGLGQPMGGTGISFRCPSLHSHWIFLPFAALAHCMALSGCTSLSHLKILTPRDHTSVGLPTRCAVSPLLLPLSFHSSPPLVSSPIFHPLSSSSPLAIAMALWVALTAVGVSIGRGSIASPPLLCT